MSTATQYVACLIKLPGNQSGGIWEWEGKRPPPAKTEGIYVPVFQKGDTLKIRNKGCTGNHIVELQPQLKNGGPGPFTDPYNETLIFEYNPDNPGLKPRVLTFQGFERIETTANWKISLTHNNKTIDPEFQVGPGNIRDDHKP